MNRASIRILNTLWFHKHGRRPRAPRGATRAAFFWQLDLATDWFRGYGRRGFTQYQCVHARGISRSIGRFLELFRELGGCSFVTVFKDCGAAGEGLLSFPQARDLPRPRSSRSARHRGHR